MATIRKFGTDGAAAAGVELPMSVKDSHKTIVEGGSFRATVVTATPGAVTSKIELRARTAGTIGTVLTARALDVQTAAGANLVCNPGGIATTATTGFMYVPSCAGIPTGIPANTYTNCVPMVFDRTNDKLYIRNTTWKSGIAIT